MSSTKYSLALLCMIMAMISAACAMGEQNSNRAGVAHKIYVGSLGTGSDAEFLRTRLRLKLAKNRNLLVVDDPVSADVLVEGIGRLWLRGYTCSNRRPSYLTRNCFDSYNAELVIKIEDRAGLDLWAGKLTPRFWGPDRVSDNVARQAAKRVADVFR